MSFEIRNRLLRRIGSVAFMLAALATVSLAPSTDQPGSALIALLNPPPAVPIAQALSEDRVSRATIGNWLAERAERVGHHDRQQSLARAQFAGVGEDGISERSHPELWRLFQSEQ